MSVGESPATQLPVGREMPGVHGGDVGGPLHVVELTPVVVGATHRVGPAEKDVPTGLHEALTLDHLNGKLFIDYLKPLRRQMITRKMQKLKRERARA